MPPAHPVERVLFLALAFAFGPGYLKVSDNFAGNHEFVSIGVVVQFTVIAVAIGFVRENLHWVDVPPAVVDQVIGRAIHCVPPATFARPAAGT